MLWLVRQQYLKRLNLGLDRHKTPEMPFNPLEGLKATATIVQLRNAALKAMNDQIPNELRCANLLEDWEA